MGYKIMCKKYEYQLLSSYWWDEYDGEIYETEEQAKKALKEAEKIDGCDLAFIIKEVW